MMNGQDFRVIRQELKWSQERLARTLGVSTGTVYNLERRSEVAPFYEFAILFLQHRLRNNG